MAGNLPKLSYVLLAHNREQYIRAAIESAFAQEYEGELEYIFSDDCSTDRTYAIMQECVAAYKGPRRVVLTQTPRNLNLARHACHAVHLATGDWIVRADDDDICFPDRCAHIAQAVARFPRALCFLEPLQLVGDADCTLARARLSEPRPAWEGECYDWQLLREQRPASPILRVSVKTYARCVFHYMDDLPGESFSVDDVSLVLRALCKGPVVALSGVPSILYRRNGSTMSGTVDGNGSLQAIRLKEEKLTQVYKHHLTGLNALRQQFLHTLENTPDQAPEREALSYFTHSYIPGLIRFTTPLAGWWQLSTWQRFMNWRREPASLNKYSFGLIRVLPRPLAIRCYSLLKRITHHSA